MNTTERGEATWGITFERLHSVVRNETLVGLCRWTDHISCTGITPLLNTRGTIHFQLARLYGGAWLDCTCTRFIQCAFPPVGSQGSTRLWTRMRLGCFAHSFSVESCLCTRAA